MMMKVLVTGGSGFIGTNLTQLLGEKGIVFCNVDTVPPKNKALQHSWVRCDIMDYSTLGKVFKEFAPTAVVHLAAETDTNPDKTIDDYKVNIVGSQNVLDAIKEAGTVQRYILTSTQFVNQSTQGPTHDQDYAPHTVYGESKIIAEKQLWASSLSITWTIIRPTNIWGPWHLRYPFEFWKMLAEKKYLHPGHSKVIRSYGYVGNVTNQILTILEKPDELVHKKVYYVGDRPIDLYDWVNGFSLKQTGKKVKVVPRFIVLLLAIIGEVFLLLKLRFPITLSRYRSMTTNNPANMERTFAELGEARYSLAEGIDETVTWMKRIYPELVTISE
jgi:nucleoside-diphosphate-sugar epimerase